MSQRYLGLDYLHWCGHSKFPHHPKTFTQRGRWLYRTKSSCHKWASGQNAIVMCILLKAGGVEVEACCGFWGEKYQGCKTPAMSQNKRDMSKNCENPRSSSRVIYQPGFPPNSIWITFYWFGKTRAQGIILSGQDKQEQLNASAVDFLCR